MSYVVDQLIAQSLNPEAMRQAVYEELKRDLHRHYIQTLMDDGSLYKRQEAFDIGWKYGDVAAANLMIEEGFITPSKRIF